MHLNSDTLNWIKNQGKTNTSEAIAKRQYTPPPENKKILNYFEVLHQCIKELY